MCKWYCSWLLELDAMRHILIRAISVISASTIWIWYQVRFVSMLAMTMAPLQRVLWAAAHVVMELCPCNYVTPALRELHCLPVMKQTDFKPCLLIHKTLVGYSPQYLSNLLTPAANAPRRQILCMSSRCDLIVPHTHRKFMERVAAPGPGTDYQWNLDNYIWHQHSSASWRYFFPELWKLKLN